MEYMHLSKSPIVEASFYIECVPTNYIDREKAKNITDKLSREFAAFKVIDDRRWRVRNLSEQIPEGSRKSIIAESEDHKILIVVRSNYLSVTLRRGYTGWSEFITLAFKYLSKYIDYTCPVKINKIGIRYVNELINLPLSSHPKAILKEVPAPRKGLACVPVEYMLKDTQYYPDSDLFSTVVQSERLMRNSPTMSWRALVDIDVFAVDPKGVQMDTIRERIEKARKLKNNLFFTLIHEEILEILK